MLKMDLRPGVIWSIMLLSLLLNISLTFSGSVENADRLNTDIYHVLSGVRYEPTSTVIASLDAEALDYFPNTPLVFWGPHFAQAINRLRDAGAAAIALDIYFAITPEQWLRTLSSLKNIPPEIIDYDQVFDQALSDGKVVLAANPIRETNRIPVPLPAEEYLAALPNHLHDVGLTTLYRDSDARIRWLIPAFNGLEKERGSSMLFQVPKGYDPPNPWWTFAALAIRAGYGSKALAHLQDETAFELSRIAYCGPPGTIPRISLAELFRDHGLTAEQQAKIKGRIVFIGAESEQFGDHQPTPYSQNALGRSYKDMSRVEIHANIAETLLHPKRIQTLHPVVSVAIWALILLLARYSCTSNIRTIAVYLMKIASVVILWPLGFVLFSFGYILPQAGSIPSITMFFFSIAVLRTICHNEQHRKKFVNIFGDKVFSALYRHNIPKIKSGN